MKRKTMNVMLMFLLAASCHCFPSQDQPYVLPSQCHQNSSPVACAINELGFNLSKLFGTTDNSFFSPLSISVALAMTYLGARGQTAEQMENALGYRSQNLSATDVHEGFRQLIASLQSGGNENSLLVANGMFLQESFAVNEQYVKDMSKIYQAVARYLNFNTNGLEAIEEINRWVDDNTRGKIQKLFEEPLDPLTRLVLLNAVYFKGTWKVQFPKDVTWDGQFHKTDGSTKNVKMMSLREESFFYFEDPQTKYKFLELPYKGEHISMLLALPTEFNAPDDLVFTSDILCRVNQSMTLTKLETVSIPKFKMEYERKLLSDLATLGMSDLFSPAADLSGIREAKDLFVSNVIHKAVIEVNEEGSEAAAVTGIVIKLASLSFDPTFIADRPFQFHIIDKRSGVVLFMGRVVDP